MKREYVTGTADSILFFTGNEVEHTPSFGLRTLFVVGVHDVKEIELRLNQTIKHIYFGANQSFRPIDNEEWIDWDQMVLYFLKKGIWVTLDFDVKYAEQVLESGVTEYNNFIPMISVKIPYIDQFNYNAVVKVDDKNFRASNPGVWCHYLSDLKDHNKFTDWSKYTKDEPI